MTLIIHDVNHNMTLLFLTPTGSIVKLDLQYKSVEVLIEKSTPPLTHLSFSSFYKSSKI